MRELLTDAEYVGVDIDPFVVAHNRERHPATRWYEADKDLADIVDASRDVIVSAFVFHFRLSRLHISTMRRILTPTGIILANVYRRSPSSRRKLASRFEREGFKVSRVPDVARVCADHEFWCLTRSARSNPSVADTVLDEVTKEMSDSVEAP
jgi:SAM-dependent methyltransferase